MRRNKVNKNEFNARETFQKIIIFCAVFLSLFIVFFIIAATGAKRELNLVLVMGAVGLSVLRTLIRFEPNSTQDIEFF
jgi:predicted membrane channel-forming protein YqfA (hemolysin III family)